MKFELMKLPYEINALEPYISSETISYHYGKHHAGYVKKLNTLVEGTEFENKSLEEIIKNATGGVFNNAAQVFNHDFYWLGLGEAPAAPSAALLERIKLDFGSMEDFKTSFLDKATTLFGSGWVWLVLGADGKLAIKQFSNADNPVHHDETPLLTCDVWEHAYYVDYRNARADYLKNYWKVINWSFVSDNLEKSR